MVHALPPKGGAIQLLIARGAPLLAPRQEVTAFSVAEPALAARELADGVRFGRFDKSARSTSCGALFAASDALTRFPQVSGNAQPLHTGAEHE